MPSPPGPTGFQNLLLTRQLFKDPRVPILENTQRYGPIWQSRLDDERGGVALVWLMGPAGNERVLAPKYKDDFSHSEGYGFSGEPLLGRDILVLLDDEPEVGASAQQTDAHRERHRLLSAGFHPRLDSLYRPEITALIGRQLNNLGADQPIDIAWELKRITFQVIAQLLVGADEGDLQHLNQLFELLGQGLFARVRLPIPGTSFYRARSAHAELLTYLQAKLTAYRQGHGEPPPILAQLLKEQSAAADVLPDETVVAELLALLLASYDTTASLLTSLMVALGDSPEVFRHLRDELLITQRTLCPEPDSTALAEADLPYLEAVLLELERLYPPLLYAIRGVRRDFEFGGYGIKRGQKVAYSAYYTGRMPEVFADPLTFAPERFLSEEGDGLRRPPAYSLLGFGGGHRMSIGKRFACLQLRLLISGLLQRFDIEFLEQKSDAIFCNPTQQRKHGYWVRLYRRHLSLPTMAQL
jgi:cytochrome P450